MPPSYGVSVGPIIVACHVNRSSVISPAEQFAGASFSNSSNSFCKRFNAILSYLNSIKYYLNEFIIMYYKNPKNPKNPKYY